MIADVLSATAPPLAERSPVVAEPAPELPRGIPMNFTRLATGGFRLDSPAAPGFAAVARSGHELLRAVDHVMREADCAAYASSRGYEYDVAALDPPPPPEARHLGKHPPSAWTPLSDGTWRSPRGRVYQPDTPPVQRVMTARTALGLSNEPG